MIRLSEQLQNLSSSSWLPSGRTTLAIMASAAHLRIPEPVNMVNILKATKMLFCGGLVQHPWGLIKANEGDVVRTSDHRDQN